MTKTEIGAGNLSARSSSSSSSSSGGGSRSSSSGSSGSNSVGVARWLTSSSDISRHGDGDSSTRSLRCAVRGFVVVVCGRKNLVG